jgi:hypothetical protein
MNETTYLENIVTPLLSRPEDLKIEQVVDEKGVLLTLTVNGEDMGRLIGKLGCTANAIRTLLRQYGALHQQHISVKINDPLIGARVYNKRPSTSDREMLE